MHMKGKGIWLGWLNFKAFYKMFNENQIPQNLYQKIKWHLAFDRTYLPNFR